MIFSGANFPAYYWWKEKWVMDLKVTSIKIVTTREVNLIMSWRDKDLHLFTVVKMNPGLIHKPEYIWRFWSSVFDFTLGYSHKTPSTYSH